MPLKLVAAAGEPVVEVPASRPLMVGRSLECDLALRDPTVSRQHAEVRLSDGAVHLRDLGSTNGTWVNGERVGEARVRPGDRVAFGKVGFEVREVQSVLPPPESPAEAALEATILRQVRVRGPADIAAQLSDETSGPSHLRIGGESTEDRQARKLQLLLDIAKELSQQTEVGRLLDKVVHLTFQLLRADRVAILTMREGAEGGQELVPRVWKSRDATGTQASWQVPRSIAQKAVAERVAVLIENAAADQSLPPSRTQSALCAPLLGSQGTSLGVLYLEDLAATHAFSEEDLDFLTAFSGMVAVALENSQLMERIEREAVVRSNFQRYFAPDLAQQIAALEGEIQLGGSKRTVAVLFSDIRGFTSLSEQMSPDEIAFLLNEYFTEMVEIVFEHGGTLDKFMGDALMALWGAPLEREDDADRATRAAVAMQRALERLNWQWIQQGRRTL
ncbi:MAG TPA: FHA domain-containing protein, partial [Thermoanaerobaculia bacterium]|nr:FHA domain-containing protein [Thermoanaerobaculia bacterium]